MTDPEQHQTHTAVVRIGKAILLLAVAGTVVAFAWKGWTWGVGFALGAFASWLNFRWIKHLVEAVAGVRPRRARMTILAGLRYALLGGGAYVILMYSSISLPAILMGLFVAVAAVILEILFQLLYARN